MNSSDKVISIWSGKEELVERYLEVFIVTFHSHHPTGDILRKFILREGDKRIREKAKGESLMLARDKGRPNDSKLLHSLEERIYQYFLEYRREHLSGIRILVNNILK